MSRVWPASVLAALVVLSACGPAFKDRRTPSGDFCSDMPVYPAGKDPDREYHRLQPVQSDRKARTEAERLESLRRAACLVQGDAIIEAVNEEIRGEDAMYVTVSSGTAIQWLRRTNNSEVTPLSGSGVKEKPTAEPDAPPEDAPTATDEPTAAPVKTAAPKATATAVPTATAVASATATATPTAKPTATTKSTAAPKSTATPKPTGTTKSGLPPKK